MKFNTFFPNWKATNNHAEKGYEILKQEGRLNLLSEIRSDLLNTDFNFNNGNKLFFGEEYLRSNFLCKQFLFSNLITIEFNKAILASVYNRKPIFYPIPPLWQGVLINNGVYISKFWCNIAWLTFVSEHLISGLLHIVRTVIYSIKLMGASEVAFSKPHSYFFNLSQSSLFLDENNFNSRNVLSWYMTLKGNQDFILMHQVNSLCSDFSFNNYVVSYNSHFLAPITSFKGLFNYFFWGIKSTSFAFFNLLIGKWLFPLFLSESALLAHVNFIDKNLLAKDFLFNNSSAFYRPLWSYLAEKRGSVILFYFYSIPTFDNVIYMEKQKELIINNILLSWSTYFVWNDNYGDYLRKFIGDMPNIISSGPILLSDSLVEFNVPKNKSISVFDIQPFRNDFFRFLGLAEEYYTPDIAIRFLSDIKTVLSEFGLILVHKRKRDVPKLVHPTYNIFLEEQKEDGFISIQPEISALKVIEKSIAVISMPFTSTAFLGTWKNKPSIYYDPTGLVSKNNPSSNDIPVINGIEELRIWVKNIIQ